MKNCLLVLLFITITFNVSAQKSQVLVARNSVGKLQVAIANKQEVKKQIVVINEGLKATEAAEKDKKTKNWSEVWSIKAYLTSYYALIETDRTNSDRYFNLSTEAIKQAKSLDKNENNESLITASYHNMMIKKQARGNDSFFNNDFLNAIDDLRDVSDFFPRDTTLALNVAICAVNIQNNDLAIKYFQRAKENGIFNAAVFQKLSQMYVSKFDNENAIRLLEEGLVLNPYQRPLINDLINLLLDTENFNKAKSLIESGLKVEKGNKLLYFLYGYLNQQNKNTNTAVLAYNKALDIDQNYFDALYQISLAYIETAKTTLKLSGTDNELQYRSLMNKAQFALQRANELNPNDRNSIELLVAIYTKKKQFDKVIELKRRARDF